MSVEPRVRQFLLNNYLFTDDDAALGNDDSLLQKGIVDSTGMMELIAFLEEQFAIRIDDDEMVPDNLDSVNNIVAFLARKSTTRNARAGA